MADVHAPLEHAPVLEDVLSLHVRLEGLRSTCSGDLATAPPRGGFTQGSIARAKKILEAKRSTLSSCRMSPAFMRCWRVFRVKVRSIYHRFVGRPSAAPNPAPSRTRDSRDGNDDGSDASNAVFFSVASTSIFAAGSPHIFIALASLLARNMVCAS